MSLGPEFDDSEDRKRESNPYQSFPHSPPQPPARETEPTPEPQDPQPAQAPRPTPQNSDNYYVSAPSPDESRNYSTSAFPQYASGPTPQSPSNFNEDKTWSIIAHAIPIATMWLSAGILGFVASIVVYILGKDKSEFIRNYSAQALNVQLNALIWFVVSWILVFVVIGLIMLPLVAIWATVLHIIAILKANDGVIWKPPFCIQFIK